MIFVDSWAWVALADRDDPFHATAVAENGRLERRREVLITSDYVLAETISLLFRGARFETSSQFIERLLQLCRAKKRHRLVHVTPDHFDHAWQMRLKYDDKPDISFVDFTSMVVMQELGITQVFTGDRHFKQVNLGFEVLPE